MFFHHVKERPHFSLTCATVNLNWDAAHWTASHTEEPAVTPVVTPHSLDHCCCGGVWGAGRVWGGQQQTFVLTNCIFAL